MIIKRSLIIMLGCFLLILIFSLAIQWLYLNPNENRINSQTAQLKKEISELDPQLKHTRQLLGDINLNKELSRAGSELSVRSEIELNILARSISLISNFGSIAEIERHSQSHVDRNHIVMRLNANASLEDLVSKLKLIGEIVDLNNMVQHPTDKSLVSFDIYLARLNGLSEKETN